MKKVIKTKILINATPNTVWSILTDYDAYPNWNPFIKTIKGEVKEGNKVTVFIKPSNRKGMKFKPKILCLETNKELRWLGVFLFKGLIDGEHKFELIDNGDKTTTFVHSEYFNGILVSLFSRRLDETKHDFKAMNKQLKVLAESR